MEPDDDEEPEEPAEVAAELTVDELPALVVAIEGAVELPSGSFKLTS